MSKWQNEDTRTLFRALLSLQTEEECRLFLEDVCTVKEITDMAQRLDTAYIELKDIAQDISSRLEDVDFDPAELDAVNERLDRLYDLQKKYHTETVAGLIAYRDDLGKKLAAIENSDEAVVEQEAKCQQLKGACQKQADAHIAAYAAQCN